MALDGVSWVRGGLVETALAARGLAVRQNRRRPLLPPGSSSQSRLRWFCRLGLEGKVRDHSTFSKNRHGRFRESDVLRHVFETVVSRSIKEGLVGGEGFAVDATLIAANANQQRSVPGSEAMNWPALAATRRSVQEYLDTLDEAAWGAASDLADMPMHEHGSPLPTDAVEKLGRNSVFSFCAGGAAIR